MIEADFDALFIAAYARCVKFRRRCVAGIRRNLLGLEAHAEKITVDVWGDGRPEAWFRDHELQFYVGTKADQG
jgi:hypothetical protein